VHVCARSVEYNIFIHIYDCGYTPCYNFVCVCVRAHTFTMMAIGRTRNSSSAYNNIPMFLPRTFYIIYHKQYRFGSIYEDAVVAYYTSLNYTQTRPITRRKISVIVRL